MLHVTHVDGMLLVKKDLFCSFKTQCTKRMNPMGTLVKTDDV